MNTATPTRTLEECAKHAEDGMGEMLNIAADLRAHAKIEADLLAALEGLRQRKSGCFCEARVRYSTHLSECDAARLAIAAAKGEK